MTSKPAHITVSRDLHNRLREAADERGIGIGKLIEKGLEFWLDSLIPVEELHLTKDPTP